METLPVIKHMSRIILRCLLIICYSYPVILYASTDYSKQFVVEDGLPSSLLYRVFSDEQGYLWISSNAGIARFNGHQFKHFGIESGMPDHEVFDIYSDSDGRIWFSTLRGIPGYIYNNQAFAYNQIQKIIDDKVMSVFPRKNGEIWFSTHNNKLYRTYNHTIVDTFGPFDSRVSGINEDVNGIWFTTHNSNFVYFVSGSSLHKIEVASNRGRYHFSRRPVILHNGDIAFYGHNFWGIIDKKTKKPRILFDNPFFKDHLIISFFQDHEDNIWLGTNKGILLFKHNKGEYAYYRNILTEFRISSMASDFEGNYWVTTLGKGLLFIPFNPVNVYSTTIPNRSNNFTTGNLSSSGEVIIASDEANLYVLKNQDLLPRIIREPKSYIGRATSNLKHSNGSLWFVKDDGIILYRNGRFQIIEKFIFAKCITEDRNGDVWIGAANGLYQFSPDGDELLHIEMGRVTAVGSHPRDLIWYGNENGIGAITATLQNKIILQSSVFNHQWISDIYADNMRDIVWVTTFNNGLFLIKKQQLLYHFNQNNGLPTSMLGNIISDKKNNIWITSRRGILHIQFKTSIPHLIHLTTTNGLKSNEVNDLIVTDSLLYVLTTDGLTVLQQKHIDFHTTPPKVYVKSVQFNHELQPIQSKYSLSYAGNQINIHLEGLAYQSYDKLWFKFKMQGLDSTWKYTYSPIIQYHSIPSGTYRFIAKAVSKEGIESEVPAEFFLTVGFAYWQTMWFKIFIGFVLLIVGLSSIMFRIRFIKKREEEKTRLTRLLSELELTALKAQMNPHFIFNSLGSIQNLINRDKKTEANVYLSKFARLLRMTLDHSDKKEISLADEIAMLELYLSLEALRFSNKFEYRIEPDSTIDLFETKIPPMILQPFLENAIKHGLLPKKADALLLIQFRKEANGTLYCLVRDNGIGRIQREKLKEKSQMGHVSKGIKITKNRLELLNQIRNKPAEISITDLYNDSGQPAGTQVEILIPTE